VKETQNKKSGQEGGRTEGGAQRGRKRRKKKIRYSSRSINLAGCRKKKKQGLRKKSFPLLEGEKGFSSLNFFRWTEKKRKKEFQHVRALKKRWGTLAHWHHSISQKKTEMIQEEPCFACRSL